MSNLELDVSRGYENSGRQRGIVGLNEAIEKSAVLSMYSKWDYVRQFFGAKVYNEKAKAYRESRKKLIEETVKFLEENSEEINKFFKELFNAL